MRGRKRLLHNNVFTRKYMIRCYFELSIAVTRFLLGNPEIEESKLTLLQGNVPCHLGLSREDCC